MLFYYFLGYNTLTFWLKLLINVNQKSIHHYDNKIFVPIYSFFIFQYGFNRISQLCDLHSQGVNFHVLKNSYVLHVGFKKPNAFHGLKDEENKHNKLIYRNFKKEKAKAAIDGRKC